VRERAESAGRGGDLDVLYSYHDSDLLDPAAADRHLEAFAGLEKAGVTWIVVSSRTADHVATTDFLDAFGATYLR
jgi:hypothetical protein